MIKGPDGPFSYCGFCGHSTFGASDVSTRISNTLYRSHSVRDANSESVAMPSCLALSSGLIAISASRCSKSFMASAWLTSSECVGGGMSTQHGRPSDVDPRTLPSGVCVRQYVSASSCDSSTASAGHVDAV